MKPKRYFFSIFALCVFAALSGRQPAAFASDPAYWSWAKKPPLGWNSWDGFATTVTEAQTRAHADFMAQKLSRYGWQYIVVDIQWYEPNATGFDYRNGAKLEVDGWGRLLPAANKFPSAAQGKGFKALADYVHQRGLKFGIHLMRGIPRQAVAVKTPIQGTRFTAADIADTKSVCPWNSDMYGVDMSKPGAQEYYNSVFALYASWGLDFIKVDDLSAPYHQSEIEAIRTAIDRTGRRIVFSTSPGATPVALGAHIREHANMWRISGDFWDNWPQLLSQFDRLRDWTPYRAPGHFPDADMLPLGVLQMGRSKTHFTPDEQYTLLSLWSIARSPLMVGADLTKLDDFTLSLLTNAEVLAVDQNSADNRELFHRDGFYGWVADVPGSPDKYLALFNARARPGELSPDRAVYQSPPISRRAADRSVKIDVGITGAKKLFLVVYDPGGRMGAEKVVWSAPMLVGANAAAAGGLQSVFASASLPAQAKSVLEYDVPEGATRFQATAGLVGPDAAAPRGFGPPGGGLRFLVFTQSPYAVEPSAPVPIALSELGLTGPCRIRDLWKKQNLPVTQGEFSPVLNAHGAGLYRVSPIKGKSK